MTDCGQTGKKTTSNYPSLADLKKTPGSVHFVGVGGIGMSALARILIGLGINVSGSDREGNEVTDELAAAGARIAIGHEAKNIEGAQAVVVSTAILNENPELRAAQTRGLPVWHRSQMLSCLTQGTRLIAVSGTHGKTTTTGMVAQVLLEGGLDPSIVVGGIFSRISSNGRLGKGQYFVAEADESDGTHAQMASHIAVITNIEADHLENYPGGIEQIRDDMASFAANSKATLICVDDLGCRLIRPRLPGRVITYGLSATSAEADYTYESLHGFAMRVFKLKECLGDIVLKVPGEHNKLNALAACAIGCEVGIEFERTARALSSFSGVARRFQHLGTEDGVTVVDDYAHHPTEVAATLQAARQYAEQAAVSGQPVKRIVALFQPHQPGRLRDLWEEFRGAFTKADLVLVADIYIARGKPIEGISSDRFSQAVRHDNVRYLPGTAADLSRAALEHIQPGDLVLTIGAGDITKVGPAMLGLLKQRHANGTTR